MRRHTLSKLPHLAVAVMVTTWGPRTGRWGGVLPVRAGAESVWSFSKQVSSSRLPSASAHSGEVQGARSASARKEIQLHHAGNQELTWDQCAPDSVVGIVVRKPYRVAVQDPGLVTCGFLIIHTN